MRIFGNVYRYKFSEGILVPKRSAAEEDSYRNRELKRLGYSTKRTSEGGGTAVETGEHRKPKFHHV